MSAVAAVVFLATETAASCSVPDDNLGVRTSGWTRGARSQAGLAIYRVAIAPLGPPGT